MLGLVLNHITHRLGFFVWLGGKVFYILVSVVFNSKLFIYIVTKASLDGLANIRPLIWEEVVEASLVIFRALIGLVVPDRHKDGVGFFVWGVNIANDNFVNLVVHSVNKYANSVSKVKKIFNN